MQQATQRLRAREKEKKGRLAARHRELTYDPARTAVEFVPDVGRARGMVEAGIEFATARLTPYPGATMPEDLRRELRRLKVDGRRPEQCFERALFFLGASNAVLLCELDFPKETVAVAYGWAASVHHALIESFFGLGRKTREALWNAGPSMGIGTGYLQTTFAGAWGASAVAYRLLKSGMRVFLPEPLEDASWKIDLIACHPDSAEGYCLQVGTGARTSCRILRDPAPAATNGYEMAFRRGVRRFNDLYRTRYLPVAVEVRISGREQQDLDRFPDLSDALHLGFPRKLGPLLG